MSNTDSPEKRETIQEFQTRMPAQPKGVRFTLDGEVIVMTDGKEIEPPIPHIAAMPAEFKLHHAAAMNTIAHFITLIKRHAPKREIPALRAELVDFGVSKKVLTELGKMGLVQERLIATLDTNRGSKPAGSRAVIYFTVFGKAYFKRCAEAVARRDDELKAVSSNGGGQSSIPEQVHSHPVQPGETLSSSSDNGHTGSGERSSEVGGPGSSDSEPTPTTNT